MLEQEKKPGARNFYPSSLLPAMNRTGKNSSLTCPFPLIVFHDPLVQLFGSPVEEIGAAVVFPTPDIHIGVVALAGFQFHAEDSGGVGH